MAWQDWLKSVPVDPELAASTNQAAQRGAYVNQVNRAQMGANPDAVPMGAANAKLNFMRPMNGFGALSGMSNIANIASGLNDIKNRGGGWFTPARPPMPENL